MLRVPARGWRACYFSCRAERMLRYDVPKDAAAGAVADEADQVRILRMVQLVDRVVEAVLGVEVRWAAQRVVERARELAVRFGRDVGRSHYQSAQVYAVLGASDPAYLDQAAAQLFRAFLANPEFQQWYRNPSPWFDPVRARIDAALGRMEDPAVVRDRMMARASARARTSDRIAER